LGIAFVKMFGRLRAFRPQCTAVLPTRLPIASEAEAPLFPAASTAACSPARRTRATRSSIAPVSLPTWCGATRSFSSGTVEASEGLSPKAEIEPPSSTQLRMLFTASALPFVGFGFLDNFLMIVFGDLIDGSICVMFGFSTMAAAAIGNTFSDTVGIFAGGFVERFATKCGIEEPEMTKEQKQLFKTKAFQYNGQSFGIILGCTLGACPLLWIDPHEGERQRREKAQEVVYATVVEKLTKMLGAEAAVLMLADEKTDELYIKAGSSNLEKGFRFNRADGFMGSVATDGHVVNIADVKEEPLYIPERHDNFAGSGLEIKSLLCVPIFAKGCVAGMIMVINKTEENLVFTDKDADILSAVCSHVSNSIGDTTQTFEEILSNCEQSMNKQGAPEWSISARQRKMDLYMPALQGVSKLLDAESTTLMLLDSTGTELYTEAIDGSLPKHHTKVGVGVAGRAVELGQNLNVGERDAYWQDDERHKNYQGSGMNVTSELVVPLFDTSRKCLGVLKCINKRTGNEFTPRDIEYLQEVGQHLSVMLEGPDAGLKRVLNLTRMRMQVKDLDSPGVACFLDSMQNLIAPDELGINPYVTATIFRGNPLLDQAVDFERRVNKERKKDKLSPVRRFMKFPVKLQNSDPTWEDSLHVAFSEDVYEAPLNELFVHVLAWDYQSIGSDICFAQTAFPISEIRLTGDKGDGVAESYPLLSVPGCRKQYSLDKAKIWLHLSRVSRASSSDLKMAPSQKVKRTVTYRPRDVGKTG